MCILTRNLSNIKYILCGKINTEKYLRNLIREPEIVLISTKVALRPLFGWIANQPLVLSFLYLFTDDPMFYYKGIALPLALCSIFWLIPCYQWYEEHINYNK